MKQYTAAEAAIELGTDPKTLRRLLRNSPDWTAPGSGGSWVFTTADLPKLKILVNGHQSKPRGGAKGKSAIDDAPGLPARLVRSRDPKDIAAVRKHTQDRVERLEAALKARGLHISQMNEFGSARRQQLAEDAIAV